MWNYLRVRGEYDAEGRAWFTILELPPRARRILEARPCWNHPRGTTSACAENTENKTLTCPHIRNYLRVRGEYLWDQLFTNV